MTKKRFIAVLLCLILALSVVLTACNTPEEPPKTDDDSDTTIVPHKHTYSEEWTSDENAHWHEALCEHKDYTSGYARHTLVNDKCTVCGREFFTRQNGFEVHPYNPITEPVLPAVPAVTTPHLAIHYHRNDVTTLTSWGFWVWDKVTNGNDGLINIQYQDDFGGVTLIDISKYGGKDGVIGIIPRAQADWIKDVDADRLITPSDYTFNENDNCYHVYIVEGDVNFHASADEVQFNNTVSFDAINHIEMKFSDAVNKVAVYEGDTLLNEGEVDKTDHVGYEMENEADLNKEYTVKAYFVEGEPQTMNVAIMALYDTEQFGEKFNYEGDDLGVTLGKTSTTFKVWSPISTSITLKLYNEGTGGTATQTLPMTKGEKGVWTATVNQNLDGQYYTYTVVNSSYPDGKEIVDPYAKSAGLNGERGMIVDFTSGRATPDDWDKVSPKSYHANELTVWETHVADVTSSATWNGTEANRKKFLGMIQSGTTYTKNNTTVKTGFDHIVELGVNAVQLVPIFDQANDEATPTFNWGYNPLNYNVLEGSYSSDASDGYVRIKEFRQLVQAFNGKGINIIMDVVYNHVGAAGGSNFDVLMPGYYFRYNEAGGLSNGSGCGNETASDRYMFRKFMIDSVCFWAKEYKLGGFRFDLMGLHDIDTMNQLAAALKKVNPSIIVYGEPWTGGTTVLSSDEQATQANANSFEGVAQFNDQMRDALIAGGMKGKTELGWASGSTLNSNITNGLMGYTGSSIKDLFKTVNYVTCHDNYTLKDRMVATGKITAADAKKHALFANSVVFTSNGITFMLAGEEFLRSKGDLATDYENDQTDEAIHNSYKSSYQMNSLNYELKADNKDLFDSYVKLIAFKQKFVKEFGLDSNEDVTANYKVEQLDAADGIVVTISVGSKTWKIAYSGPKGGVTADFGGYTLYLDTLGTAQLSANTQLQAYQTVIAYK